MANTNNSKFSAQLVHVLHISGILSLILKEIRQLAVHLDIDSHHPERDPREENEEMGEEGSMIGSFEDI